mgnify:FL=1
MKKYSIFHREWWKENPAWPNGLEPCIGEPSKIGEADTKAEAREMCRKWNAERKQRFGGSAFKRMERLSDKAEFKVNWDMPQ